MSKKKKDENKPEENAPVVSNSDANVETKSSPIYLVETLMGMDEIKQYGLNKYFLRAILDKKFYTLDEAHAAIQKAIEGK